MDEKFYQMPEPFKSSGYVDEASAPPPYPASAPTQEPEQDENLNFRRPNASKIITNLKSKLCLILIFNGFSNIKVIDQESDSDFVLVTIKIPGLQCKRKLNLSKTPKNGRIVGVEYKKK